MTAARAKPSAAPSGRTGMRAFAVLALLAALPLAGCLAPGASIEGPTPTPEAPLQRELTGEACVNSVLFQLLDFAVANPFLPPGYIAKDPQEFLGSPASFGQAAAVLLLMDCPRPAGDWRSGFIGIFVEPPAVPGVEEAVNLDFYEVEHYGEDFDGLLGRLGWPVAANSTVRFETSPLSDGPVRLGYIEQRQDGDLLTLLTSHVGRYTLANGPVRLWHELDNGTAYVDYDAPLTADFGSAACMVRPGSVLAQLLGNAPQPPVGGQLVACSESRLRLGAQLPALSFSATLRFLPDAFAQ